MMIFEDSYHGITFSYKEYEKMHSPLAGQCQRENLATALRSYPLSEQTGVSRLQKRQVREGLSKTKMDRTVYLPVRVPVIFRRRSA